MRSTVLLGALLALAATAGAAAGCSTKGDGSAVSESQVTAAELSMAKAAQDVISGAHAHCNQCHTAGRSDVRRWGDAMLNVGIQCFNEPALEPTAQVACMSDEPGTPTSSFSTSKLGLFSAGTEYVKDTFTKADPSGARLTAFRSIAMPAGSSVPQMTAEEFEKVVTWVFNGMPAFNEVFGGPPEPEACVPSITPELTAHVAEMKTTGWGARLADVATPMFGCADATDAKDCFKTLPVVAAPWGAAGVTQTLRVLRELPKTSYWVRSSADGRFVGYGQFTAAAIIDLSTAQGTPAIEVDARYDPAFFPDNDGISFAGTNLASETPGPIRVCRQSVLVEAAKQAHPKITLQEPGCSEVVDSVYQSVGAALDGRAFWMSNGAHVNDDGGNQIQAPLDGFEPDSMTQLIPMVSDGIGYKPQKPVNLKTPLEGDQMLSPSSRLLLTRFGSKPGHQGFTIRKLTTNATDGAGVTGTTEVIGKICGGGTKAMVSFDERFVVTHRYAAPGADGGTADKHSDITLTDLLTGEVVEVTHMGPNEYALYPHFRADGWLYFLVRDMNPTGPDGGPGKETLVASDVALKRL